MSLDPRLAKLRQLGDLIQTAINDVVDLSGDSDGTLPGQQLFDAQKILLSASGLITELISSPSSRLLEVSSQYYESRALHIVADKRIPDILAKAGDEGVDVVTLAQEVQIESRKLSRLMRCLCSIHVFQEVAPDVFANSRISEALVRNEPLRAYLLVFGLVFYSSSAYLPRTLNDPETGPSYDVTSTSMQLATGTSKPLWEWFEEKITVKDVLDGNTGPDGRSSGYPGVFGSELEAAVRGKNTNELIPRPEISNFGLAMIGGGRVHTEAHLYDFPWQTLGPSTFVDVGGGVGGFCLELSRLYPDFRFIVQDRPPVLEQAKSEFWPIEDPTALEQGRVVLQPHDFFTENPVKNAEVYWLRYIIHDWSDDYCVKILGAIKPSMGPRSRILICEQVMNTTIGSAGLSRAPEPLPANWGYFTRYSHQRDLAMMTMINGIERRPEEFKDIVERAGLRVRKFWECRSQVGLVEVVRQDSELL